MVEKTPHEIKQSLNVESPIWAVYTDQVTGFTAFHIICVDVPQVFLWVIGHCSLPKILILRLIQLEEIAQERFL